MGDGLSPYLLGIQRQVGNRAVVTLLARQVAPTTAAPPESGVLAKALERELSGAPRLEHGFELADALAAAATRTVGRAADDDQRAQVERRAAEILSVHRWVGDTTYDVHSALKGLNDLQRAGNADPEAPDLHLSYGLRLVTSRLAEHAAEHVLTALTPSITPGDTLAFVGDDLDVAVNALSDGSALLDLELEGTLLALTDARENFQAAPAGEDRAPYGAEIGRLARRALLLDRQLTGVGKANPLDRHLTTIGARIAAIRNQAQTEDESMKAMDTDLSLLGENVTPIRHADYTLPLDPTILPEEAFPKATDAASDEFMGELADRLADQAKQLEELKDKVVPKSPTFRLDELAQVHARWWGFFSAEQERRDMALNPFWQLLDKGWDVLGNAALPSQVAISAAVVRAQMLSQFSTFIGMMMGEATSTFSGEVASPQRVEPDVTGSARHPDYSFAEVQPQVSRNRHGSLVRRTPGIEPSGKGEAGSRAEYVAEERARTAREFTDLARHQAPAKEAAARGITPDEKPIVGLHSVEAQEGWSYLVDVRDLVGTGDIVAREHKVMAAEVAEYLTAARQHAASRSAPHRPKAGGRPLGETAIRRGGVEAGEGTAAARYLEGADRPEPSAAANRLRHHLQAADERMATAKAKGPTRVLLEDLEGYLDEFFVANQAKGVRVAAIFLIGQREHDVGAQLFGLLDPAALQHLITEAIKVTVIMNILQRMGPLGTLAALAYQTYLKSQGVSNVAAFIGIATFMWEASSTDDFRQARAFALMSKKIVGDAAELLEDLLAKPVDIGLGKLAENPPSGAREAADALAPILRDPAARQQLLNGANAEIARLEAEQTLTGSSNPELDAWRVFRNQIEGVSRPGDPPVGADVPLDVRSPGKTALDTAFVEPGRTSRSTRALHEGLGDLSGKVPIIENPDPALGATVRVHYDGGQVRMEVGPEAGKREVQQHYETARILYRYQTPVGRILRLLERATSWLTGQKGHGSAQFEARLEVRKLRTMIDELSGEKLAIDALARRMSTDPGAAATRAKDLDARLTDLEAQLAYHEKQLTSVEAGRGWVAAEDRRRPRRPKGFETTQYRPSKLRVKAGTVPGLESTRPPTGRPQVREVTVEEQIHSINFEWDKVRAATPTTALRRKAQAELPEGAPDPAFPGRVTDGPGQADHIVSVDRIRRMPGFAALDVKRQIEILNLESNFVALSPMANRSKGALSFSEWKGHKGMDVQADPKWLDEMIQREREQILIIERKINELLREQMNEQQWQGPDPARTP